MQDCFRKIRRTHPFLVLAFSLLAANRAAGQQATIKVEAGKVVNRITPWMIGSCIEDVNHEIYGGLYAQQIFGESFEEPPLSGSPLEGWNAYGGRWTVKEGALSVASDAGAKLVRESPEIRDGTVECDVRLADNSAGNAALILRVSDARVGPDNWTGYEISLVAQDRALSISRHHNDWHLLKAVPADIQPGRWIHVKAELAGPTIRLTLDHAPRPNLEFTDSAQAILSGRVGLRTWNVDASFRNLVITTAKGTETDRLATAKPAPALGEVSGMWDAVQTGAATARFGWDAERHFNSLHSQRITLETGAGTAGIANRGLNRWGIAVKQGAAYAGRLYACCEGTAVPIVVALQSADGSRTYARQRLAPAGSEWARRDFTLRSNAADPNACFSCGIDRPGTVWIDQVSLAPTGSGLYHGLPIRADIAKALETQGLKFLRYGGSMVNADAYRWKKMLGDRDRRPQYRGTWYPYSSNGFGIEEFVQYCEAAHIEPAFAINIDETPEDAADLVEYLNGPPTTVWGKKRAENGHPKPYNLRYIEIGNEEAINGDKAWYARYLERFHLLSIAMHARDPNLQLVIAAWWRPDEPFCKRIQQELNGKAALWDVHVGGDGLRDGEDVDRTLTQMQRRFQEWSPGTTMKACIFEENGGRHDMQRALGHAHILNVTQRHGDFVLMDCPANCLQPLGQNDNGWDQGQVFFTPDKVWGMPPFYAQQMAARNYLPLHVQEQVSGTTSLDVTAARSEDGKTLVLHVVNLSASPQQAALQITGFGDFPKRGEVWTLAGDLKAINTPADPEHIRWKQTNLEKPAESFSYTFPAYSYTILRLMR